MYRFLRVKSIVGYTIKMLDVTFNPLLVLLIVFLSMAIHELMHAVTSYWLGDDTAYRMGRITLNPLKSIDPVLTLALPLLLAIGGSPIIFGAAKPVQVNFYRLKWDEFGGAIVGISGPLTNLAIAVVAAISINLLHPISTSGLFQFLYTIVAVNIGFFVFNMIPWPPLDGSRVLYAFAPRPLQEFMQSVEQNFMMSLLVFWFSLYLFLWDPLINVITRLIDILVT